MPESHEISFHLLRPVWLLALLPVLAILMLVLRRQRPELQWSGLIAPHLLRHLLVKPERKWRIQPAYLVATALAFAIIALSGPSWRRELPPFVEDKAPLIIALAVKSSMSEQDVPPTRLERAKQKIRDLLAARTGARTGLIAYAGTAHLVMPLTDDRSVLEPFLAALAPDLMPTEGKNLAAAVALAASSLAMESLPGTILIVADDVSSLEETRLRTAAGHNGLAILIVMPSRTESSELDDAVTVTVDGSDLRALERRIDRHFQTARTGQFGSRWQDEGYWLLLPVALLCLLWFRRGTTVQWAVLLLTMLHNGPVAAQDSSALRHLWLTPDQQGRFAFERGDYAAAKTLFVDPMWRGIAAYRGFDFLAAAEAFQVVDTPEGRFALGNAQAQNHAYQKAIEAYDEVLKAQPDNSAARTNRAIVLSALQKQEDKRRKQEEGDNAPEQKADATRIDPKQKGGKRLRITPEDLTTAGAAEAWMRELQTSPADFLKLKFAIQAGSPSPLPGGGR
jgi:Ca-activated chloride channel family protein